MKLAFVVPRYGAEVIGGAELGARTLAEHLVSELGWRVEVHTTAALDHRTWADVLPTGTTIEAGVVVHRHRSASGRVADFDERSGPVLRHPREVSPERAEEWLRWQGPVCPDAVEAALASDADRLVAYPYLYWPTVEVVRRAGDRTVLHPAAHDEAPLHLPTFDPVFEGAGALAFHTLSEQALVQRRFPASAARPQRVIGLGVDEAPQDDPATACAALTAFGLEDRPYVVCLGRVERSKGTDLLARYVEAYAARRPDAPRLVLVGPVVDRPPVSPHVVVTGPVDEATKWALLRGAQVLVSPSVNESFSLVVLEAWLAGIPVVVNAACGPTVEHCQLSGGGFWFDGYATFEVVLDRLGRDGPLRDALAARGATYVGQRYRWPVLVRRYAELLGVPIPDVADAPRPDAADPPVVEGP